jgi:hypothetical protein
MFDSDPQMRGRASLVLREDAGELTGGVDSDTRRYSTRGLLIPVVQTPKLVREQHNRAGAIPVRSI